MKKYLCIALFALLLLGICACAELPPAAEPEQTPEPVVETGETGEPGDCFGEPEEAAPGEEPVPENPAVELPTGPLAGPPKLVVSCGDQEIETGSGNYNWSQDLGNGTMSEVIACGFHPLEDPKYLQALCITGTAVLDFDGHWPDRVAIRRWSTDHWGNYDAQSETVSLEQNQLYLDEPGYVYEVSAKWNGLGSASYAFYTPALGITLTVENVCATGLTLVCTQSGSMPAGELSSGSYYVLERRVNDQWETVPYIVEGDVAWTEEAWNIPTEDPVRWEHDWQPLYGELEPDEYRIGKMILNVRAPGDYDRYLIYSAAFRVDG